MEIPFVTMLGFQRAHKKGRREENVKVQKNPISSLCPFPVYSRDSPPGNESRVVEVVLQEPYIVSFPFLDVAADHWLETAARDCNRKVSR